MKISIGSKIVDGPWGGGNLFVKNLSNFLTQQGCDVFYDLLEPDLDIILMIDPRSKFTSSSTFNHKDITIYKKFINKNVLVIHRINECDERKNTNNINQYYLKASQIADSVIFVSNWLRDIYLKLGMPIEKTEVILAGSDKNIFNLNNHKVWDRKSKLKIVTHHWSSHENKGFIDYKRIDNLLEKEYWNSKLEFTYIGNLNKNFVFKNIKCITPLSGVDLAKEIKNHHFYFTGSLNEPSGNHHIEAAQCGLPIIYKDSGGLPEYCNGFGIKYIDNIEQAFDEALKNYEKYYKKIKNYPRNSDTMSNQFLELFHSKIKESTNFYKRSRLFFVPIIYFKFQKNFVASIIYLKTFIILRLKKFKLFLYKLTKFNTKYSKT
jgi:glycosyltransferase involved in cell wall biosynthesis